MTRYEYSLLVSPFHLNVINAQGQDGWRYVDKLDNPQGGPPILIFEREIQEDKRPAEIEVPYADIGENAEPIRPSINEKLKSKLKTKAPVE